MNLEQYVAENQPPEAGEQPEEPSEQLALDDKPAASADKQKSEWKTVCSTIPLVLFLLFSGHRRTEGCYSKKFIAQNTIANGCGYDA